jgi:hypothetical protein
MIATTVNAMVWRISFPFILLIRAEYATPPVFDQEEHHWTLKSSVIESDVIGRFSVLSSVGVMTFVNITSSLGSSDLFLRVVNNSAVLSTKTFMYLVRQHFELPVRGYLVAVDYRGSCVRKGIEGYDSLNERTMGPCLSTVPFTLAINVSKQAIVNEIRHEFKHFPTPRRYSFAFDHLVDPFNPNIHGL